MKTRIFEFKNLVSGLAGLFLLLLTTAAHSQSCGTGNTATLSIGNFSQTSTTIEYDVYMTFTSAIVNKFSAYGGNVIYNSGLLPAGATGTLTVVDQPNAAQFPGIAATTVTPTHNVAARSLRWTFLPAISPSSAAPVMAANVAIKFCRFRFTSTLPWTSNFAGSLAFNHNSAGGNPLNLITTYCSTNTATSNISLANGNLTLATGQTQNTPFTFTLNPAPTCPTAATAGSLVAESPCAGAANGSAVITLTGAPNASAAVTYTVDGGATQNATLSSSAFTVTGLSAGNHVVSVTYPSCSAVSTGTFNIGAGAPLTNNGSVITSICQGGSYTWPANGVTYTTAQSGTTFVSGCNTATLTLTVNPTTTNGSATETICQGQTYVWPANGQSYTTAQEGTTFVSGCNVATLNLTVTPATTTGSETRSECGESYTWPVSGLSYTSSGVYPYVVGCNTATLTLTLSPNTTNGSLTTSACDSYTWAESGTTYTSTGVYTHVTGCNTATLNLTITPSTTNGSVTTSICSGDTYVWPANGQSYTTAQSGTTFVSGCNTATLNLTVTPSTTNGSLTTTACDTYTWTGALASGDTYTSSGVYTHVTGCNTATLNLTITPSTTNGSVTTSICSGQTYVWPANGQSYTTAQSGTTFVSGCNTATLNLTVTPSTTDGSLTTEACGSYTWAENGTTYTSTGVYTHVTGCNTATLNLTINTSAQTFYADADGDNFGAGAPILSCTGQPEGTSTNNTDCAPNDATKWRTANFFVDADGDGYNNGFPASSVCYGATTPAGYVAVNNGVDCNDESASVNPNASEILGNGSDDNCDGTIDEVTPLTSLAPASCGATLTSLESSIFANPLTSFAGAGTVTGYRWRVTNGATVRILDTPSNRFNLMQLPGGATYATTYTVEVSVKSNGFFRAYGPACTVSTPAVPNSTSISNPTCGSTLTSITQSIFCVSVPSASGYRFRVRNGATLVGTVDKTTNRFSLLDLGVNNISFGTTYTVDVLLAFGGNLRPDSEYGSPCSITTPATPATSRVIQPSCGSTITRLWTTIFAQQITGAQGYKFVVTNGAQTREYATANPRFQLPLLSGGAAANTAYTIRVDVLYNSSYVQGTVLCTITTSPTATRQANAALDIYEVSAYPNPYAETFKLNVNTSSEDQVGVKVYDMLGREVESRQASVSAITNLEIGSQYPSGVYNIIVTQGDNVKTVRVIKR